MSGIGVTGKPTTCPKCNEVTQCKAYTGGCVKVLCENCKICFIIDMAGNCIELHRDFYGEKK